MKTLKEEKMDWEVTMTNETFRFETGKLKCTAVSDGTLTYAAPPFPSPAALLFANVAKERLERTFLEHDLRP